MKLLRRHSALALLFLYVGFPAFGQQSQEVTFSLEVSKDRLGVN